MEEVVDKNEQYTDRYIAFLDLLGFKNTLNNKTCSQILSIFSKIKIPLEGVYIGTGTGWEPIIDNASIKKVNLKIMSDSICFYVDAIEPNAFVALISVCLLFQVMMAELADPVILRGGIVRGDLYAEGDTTFGPGLTAAYLLEEKSAKFPRIIMTGDLLEKAWEETEEKCKRIIKDQIYRDDDGFYIINYLGMLPYGTKGRLPAQAFYNHVIKMLNHEIDASIREKYLYLEKRIKIVLEKNMQELIRYGVSQALSDLEKNTEDNKNCKD